MLAIKKLKISENAPNVCEYKNWRLSVLTERVENGIYLFVCLIWYIYNVDSTKSILILNVNSEELFVKICLFSWVV